MLRFSKGVQVKSSDKGRTEKKQNNPDYPYNLNLHFEVGMPGFRFVENPKDELRVSVSMPMENYGTGRFEDKVDSFSSRVDLWANYKCRRAAEMGPGVFALRQPTKDEIQVLAETYGTDLHCGQSRHIFPVECDIAGAVGRGEEIFAVYDGSGHAVGYGNRRPPQKRRAIWGATRAIYARIVRLLTDATDLEKSFNLGDAVGHGVGVNPDLRE